MADNFDDVSNSAKNVGDVLTTVGKTLADMSQQLINVGTTSKNVLDVMNTSFKGLSDMLNNVEKQFEDLDDSTTKTATSVEGFISKLARLKEFANNEKMFEKFSSDAQSQFGSITDSIGAMGTDLEGLNKIAGMLGLPTDKVKGFLSALAENAAQGQKAEAQFLGMINASGRLGDMLHQGTTRFKDIGAATAEYNEQMAKVAAATGFTIKETIGLSDQLGRIPGFLNSVITSGDGAGGSLDGLTGVMRLMSGTMQPQSAIIEEMTNAYDNLSQSQGKVADSTQKGAQLISTMAEVSRVGNIQFKDAKSLLEEVAQQFRFVGDETEGAARVFGRFSEALQSTGLTAKASLDIIKGMIKSVSDLSMGTKAFLSLKSGGPGGLQGAFRIEQMLRDGKLDQVMSMMERGLKQQFGGRIYSQAEAAQSPEAAAQFQRQRSLLQSGVFGIGKGANDEQATRILEALKSNNLGQLQDVIKTGQDAVKNTTDIGNQIQERNYTQLTRMAQFSERTTIAAELQASLDLRRYFGSESAAAGQLGNFKQQAQGEARTTAGNKTIGTPQDSLRNDLDKMIQQGTQAFMKGVGGVFTGIRDAAGDAAKVADELGDANREAEDLLNNQAPPVRPPPPTVPVDGARQQVFNRAVGSAGPRPGTPTPQLAAVTPQQPQTKQVPQEIVLKIDLTAPDGFDAKVVSTSDMIKIFKQWNKATAGGGGPGY